MSLITFDNVSRIYENGDHKQKALDHVNMSLEEGKFVVILGPSGAGKSTLLNLLGGLDSPTEGKITVNGKDISGLSGNELADYRASTVGFVFQFYNLIPTLTVHENVTLVKEIAPNALSATEMLREVGLEDHLKNFPSELSGGEQQRVAVARALAHGPKLIIADEPTGNIDPEMSMDIMQLFEAINKVNITVVVVTHEHELVHKLARKYNNRVIELANGMVASDTSHPEVARRYAARMAERENGYDDYEDYDDEE